MMDFRHASMQVAQEAKTMVEDSISVEIGSSTVERRSNPSATGFVYSNPFALSTCDTTWALPDFVPLGSVSWPEPLLAIWRTMNYSSLVGLFPMLARAWFTVDNKLGLWDYRTRREFCLYDEIPEIIVAVGAPVKARSDVFQPHVTYVLPVATASTVFLLGLCIVHGEELSEIKIVNLGYSVAAGTIITKIVGVVDSGRIFCAGADGNVYELRYTREGTPIVPKIRLVCFSYLFSSRPILGQITSVVNSVKQTWTGPNPGLRDIVVDERRELLVGLDEHNTIAAWKVVPDGLKMVRSLRHQPRTGGRKQSTQDPRSDDGGFSPLLKLFVIQPDPDGCTLIAIAQNGDQFRYRYLSSMADDYHVDLSMRSFTPSYLRNSQEVSVCYAAEAAVLIACYEREDDASADKIVAVTSPRTIIDPHNNCRDVVAAEDVSSSGIVRVDAIAMVPNAPRRSPNDICAQVCYPATRFIIAHRHGLSTYMQMRPVDTLYAILSTSNIKCKESLLKRFANVYNATDYAAMLLQIAIGALNPGDTQGVFLQEHCISTMPTVAAQGGVSLEQLSQKLREGNVLEARRLAQELLRNMTLPVTQTGGAGLAGGYQVAVIMSPFSTGIVTYIARALYSIWEVPISKLPCEHFGPLETVLSRLIQYLESMDIGTHGEQNFRVDVPHQWQRNRVVVSLPEGTHLSIHDVNRFQLVMLHSCYQVASRALQTAVLLQQSCHIPVQQSDRTVTFSQLVRDQEAAHRYAHYISRVILTSQEGMLAANSARVKTFTQLQKRCPYFFNTIDLQEMQARSEIDTFTRGESLGAFSDARLADWLASVSPNAALYWNSGVLPGICQQLCEAKREGTAAQLLLHAAAQLDPSGAAVALHLAERGGGVVGGTGGNVTLNTSMSPGINASSVRFSAPPALAGPALYSAYQTKLRVLDLLVRLLESAWHTHRSAVDGLLGGPRSSGSIWSIESGDELTHCYLFDWLCAPREDAAISRTLRDTLVSARSPFLEKYLTRNALVLGEEYARYLRRTQRNYKAAIEQSVLLAESALQDIPEADRLSYRVRCLTEALECARECGSDQAQQVEQRLRLMQAQQRLCGVIAGFLGSGYARLDTVWTVEGRRVTERELALQHMDLVANRVCTTTNLLEIAGMYSTLGGAEVQLDVLVASNVYDSATYAACIVRAYALRNTTAEAVSRRLIERYYRPTVSFPISFVIRMLETHQFRASPRGSSKTVQLLMDCNVDMKVIFHAYQEIVESKEDIDVICEPFVKAQVTAGFLIFSLATVVVNMAIAARRGTLQQVIVSSAIGVVHTYHAQAAQAFSGSQDEKEAFYQAESLLDRADNILNTGGSAYF